MRFKPGQKVVCIATGHGGLWADRNRGPVIGPDYNDECTVTNYVTDKIMCVKEFPYEYNEIHFEPLLDDKVITELLEESLQPKTETV